METFYEIVKKFSTAP